MPRLGGVKSKQPDDVDQALQLGIDNTSESWKKALVVAVADARSRDRLILRIAVATFLVAAATLFVTVLK